MNDATRHYAIEVARAHSIKTRHPRYDAIKVVRLYLHWCAPMRAWKCLSYPPDCIWNPRGGPLRCYRCICAFTFSHICPDRPVNIGRANVDRDVSANMPIVLCNHDTVRENLRWLASSPSASTYGVRRASFACIAVSGFSSASIPRSNLATNASWKSCGTRDYYYWNNGVYAATYTISHSLEIESRRTATVDFAAIVGRTRNRHYVNM